jgi:hypothetical protein
MSRFRAASVGFGFSVAITRSLQTDSDLDAEAIVGSHGSAYYIYLYRQGS